LKLINFMFQRIDSLLRLTCAHAWLVILSMFFAIIIAVTSGILITLPSWPKKTMTRNLLFSLAVLIGIFLLSMLHNKIAISTIVVFGLVWSLFVSLIFYRSIAGHLILYIDSIIMTIPSIALFGLFIPMLGIGFLNAVVALILYAQLPIIRNTYTGITGIDPSVVDAARGMGMNSYQIVLKVKIPIALPVIMAGIRTATVMIAGIAAIASYIGAKSLGEFIFRGISRGSTNMMLTGAIWVGVFAVLTDFFLGKLEKWFTPEGLRKD